MTPKAQDLVARALHAHKTLTTESDLSPRNDRINDALTAFVSGIMAGYTAVEERDVLTDPRVTAMRPELLEKLSIAEGEMEKYWAAEFAARPTLTPEDFKDFIYWNCYDRLVGREIAQLPPGMNMGEGQSIAFIGAGPLPLTAIIMHMRTGAPVTCVDSDPVACALAAEILRKSGLAGIDVKCETGADHDYTDNPVVFIASLVPRKKDVFDRISETSPRSYVGVRSAERLHTLLYDPVDEDELQAAGNRYIRRTAHDPRTINTTVFYETHPAPAITQKPRPAQNAARPGF